MSASGGFRVVIPARYGSTRLPGKALLPLAGKPMLQWVYERARACTAQEVLIATDDARIAAAAEGFGATVAMTRTDHPSGTDRIAEVARLRAWASDEVVVNVQGDEPLMPPVLIDQVARMLQDHPQAGVATLASPIRSLEEFFNPNVVKVVADPEGRALYFSRAPIPWNRDSAPAGLASQTSWAGARRHIGIYAYRVAALQRLATLPSSELESREKLEQLRALSVGIEMRIADARERPGPDVNTREDADRAATMLSAGA